MQRQLVGSSILVAVVAVLLLGVPFAIISGVAGNELTGWMSVAVIAGLGVVAVAAGVGVGIWRSRRFTRLMGVLAERGRDARLRSCPAALQAERHRGGRQGLRAAQPQR